MLSSHTRNSFSASPPNRFHKPSGWESQGVSLQEKRSRLTTGEASDILITGKLCCWLAIEKFLLRRQPCRFQKTRLRIVGRFSSRETLSINGRSCARGDVDHGETRSKRRANERASRRLGDNRMQSVLVIGTFATRQATNGSENQTNRAVARNGIQRPNVGPPTKAGGFPAYGGRRYAP